MRAFKQEDIFQIKEDAPKCFFWALLIFLYVGLQDCKWA